MRRSRFGEGDMLTLSLPTVVAPNLRLWETAGWNTSCEATEAIAKLGISRKRRYFEDILMRLYPGMNADTRLHVILRFTTFCCYI